MKLLVQEFLETHSLKDLQMIHGVYASISKNKRKISLNYDQIETKENDILSHDCRGLILSKDDFSEFQTIDGKLELEAIVGRTQVIAFGMRRFFNYGQGSAAEINWTDAKLAVLEKLDGTLCIVYFDPFTSHWCVATRSVPEADLLMDNGLFTFRTLFEKAMQETTKLTFDEFTALLDPSNTYCFELTTPYNRIVVQYSNNGITLLAVRSTLTYEEFDVNHTLVSTKLSHVVPFVKSYQYHNIDELLMWVSLLNPMEHEGVVVRDSNFNRIKVKNANYVAYNKVRDTLATSERNCIELILAEKDDDVIPFLPEEIVKNIQKLKTGLHQAMKNHEFSYRGIKDFMEKNDLDDKKSFALLVQELVDAHPHIWAAPFFQMFDNKVSSMKDFVSKNRKDGTWGSSFLDKLLHLAKHSE